MNISHTNLAKNQQEISNEINRVQKQSRTSTLSHRSHRIQKTNQNYLLTF